MHDSIRLEDAGIPTVAVATREFRNAAGVQAARLGRPDYQLIYVEHPIQDQVEEVIRQRADASLEEIVNRLLR